MRSERGLENDLAAMSVSKRDHQRPIPSPSGAFLSISLFLVWSKCAHATTIMSAEANSRFELAVCLPNRVHVLRYPSSPSLRENVIIIYGGEGDHRDQLLVLGGARACCTLRLQSLQLLSHFLGTPASH